MPARQLRDKVNLHSSFFRFYPVHSREPAIVRDVSGPVVAARN